MEPEDRVQPIDPKTLLPYSREIQYEEGHKPMEVYCENEWSTLSPKNGFTERKGFNARA